jgi:hypothetical protein
MISGNAKTLYGKQSRAMDIRNYPKSIFCNQKIQILTVMI